MSERTPAWDLYETFLAVHREGSFSAAARLLGTAQPTVRRRIAALERRLGVLFARSPNGLLPTAGADQVLPYAEAMEAMAAAGLRSSSTSTVVEKGVVRLTCSEVFGVEILPPILARLIQKHPAVEIELVATNVVEDMLRRDADVAVRMSRPTQTGLVAQRIGTVSVGLFASVEYLASHPAPQSIAELAEHRLIAGDRNQALQDALRDMVPEVLISTAYRTDGDIAQLAAVRAGIGIGVCQIALASRMPELKRVLAQFSRSLDVWIVMHEDLRAIPAVRLLFDFLGSELKGSIDKTI